MKKYIKPAIKTLDIINEQILAGSLEGQIGKPFSDGSDVGARRRGVIYDDCDDWDDEED